MKLTQNIIDNVTRYGSYDTAKYRYIYKEFPDRAEIRKLPLSQLDTTAAIDGWETVMVIR